MRALGIDLGGSAIKWALLAEDQTIIEYGRERTPPGPAEVIAVLAGIAARTTARAIGVGVPGHVDRDTGVVRFIPNLSGRWTGLGLGERLAERVGRPVRVLNDARAFCLAELVLGAARGRSDVLFLTLGTGVGGGIAVGGRLLCGPDDRLGEIGHYTYDPTGPVCGCGGRGCLEMYASGPALVAQFAAGRSLTDGGGAAEVVAAARADDPAAGAVLARAGRAIGTVLASMCAVMASEAVVIGGGVAGGLPLLRPHIEAALARRASFIGKVEVLAAQLGEYAGAAGAALATRQEGTTP